MNVRKNQIELIIKNLQELEALAAQSAKKVSDTPTVNSLSREAGFLIGGMGSAIYDLQYLIK